MHVFKAQEDKCIPQVNEEVKTEASQKGKPTYQAGTYTAARYNPYGLETPNTPRRLPRPAYEHRPAGYAGDRLSYIADENTGEIVAKLKTYEGQSLSSWLLFVMCMKTRAGPGFVISNYIKEQLTPAQMEGSRDDEDSCVSIVNDKLDDEARLKHAHASVPVRTYPPLNPRRQTGRRNEFSITAPVEALSHRAARFVTTESHRLHLGALARPLQQFMREAPKKMWEIEVAH
ncbi:MAG: hypothetical protein M1826_003156 [Phylliscum demangeonii]|nr:MAG: hypothetical protein M1826_003156 [Phylliscum demangeonii]